MPRQAGPVQSTNPGKTKVSASELAQMGRLANLKSLLILGAFDWRAGISTAMLLWTRTTITEAAPANWFRSLSLIPLIR